jgi:short-subunit dehydrogenase
MANILIIGATSVIAQAVARRLAQRGYDIFLCARDPERLNRMVQDLKIRGAGLVDSFQLDVNDLDAHTSTLNLSIQKMKRIEMALIAHGTLPDQYACQSDSKLLYSEVLTNSISTISLLSIIGEIMEKQGEGHIAVITSVAGDRGRQSNYVYGAAKGMVSIFLQGLRNRLHKSNITVLDIKPGFVDTPMTKKFEKGLLWSKPETIAKGIIKSIDKKKDIVYLPFYWKYIMLLIRCLPEKIFKQLSL